MRTLEIVHDHTFNTTSAENLLQDFEATVQDKVFVAAYALEKKMPEVVPPLDYAGWRLNCFDTYDIEEQFRENQNTLEIRNDSNHFDFQIGKKALSDVSEVSDIGDWEDLLRLVLDHLHGPDPNTTDLYHFRKKVYDNLIIPFKLKRTVYFPLDTLDTDFFLKNGVLSATEEHKNKQDLEIKSLDQKNMEFENMEKLFSTIFIDEYRDFR
ncbi:hypothetical protein RCC89_14680 [Cytophagaceae bacterium ABcell3]|nr:hypothetical protein RCC89_14680 [Cytophagaceae bacterium ABcell3]